MERVGVTKKTSNSTNICIENAKAKVRIGKNISKIFSIINSLKQSDGLLPQLFNVMLD